MSDVQTQGVGQEDVVSEFELWGLHSTAAAYIVIVMKCCRLHEMHATWLPVHTPGRTQHL